MRFPLNCGTAGIIGVWAGVIGTGFGVCKGVSIGVCIGVRRVVCKVFWKFICNGVSAGVRGAVLWMMSGFVCELHCNSNGACENILGMLSVKKKYFPYVFYFNRFFIREMWCFHCLLGFWGFPQVEIWSKVCLNMFETINGWFRLKNHAKTPLFDQFSAQYTIFYS